MQPPSASGPDIFVQDIISNISLAGHSITDPIPGSTITRYVHYSNSGSVSSTNTVIYCKIVTNAVFEDMITDEWISEYSDMSNPDQSFNSSDYHSLPAFIWNR